MHHSIFFSPAAYVCCLFAICENRDDYYIKYDTRTNNNNNNGSCYALFYCSQLSYETFCICSYIFTAFHEACSTTPLFGVFCVKQAQQTIFVGLHLSFIFFTAHNKSLKSIIYESAMYRISPNNSDPQIVRTWCFLLKIIIFSALIIRTAKID